MTARTPEELQDRLDDEFAWRRKELTDLKLVIGTAEGSMQRTFLRAGAALLYAHWEAGLRRSCVMSVSSEADPEGIRGWCGSRLRWRSPSARRLHQTVRTGDFAHATAATGAYGHAAVAWKPLVDNHAPRSGPSRRRRTVTSPGPSESGRPVGGLERS